MINSIPANKYCQKIFDGTHDTPKPSLSGMPLVTSKNILGGKLNLQDAYNISKKDYTAIQKRSSVSQWDVLFSMIGSVGEVYLEKNKDIPYAIKNVGVFSCGDEYKSKWLYYYLQSPTSKKFINNYLAGAVQKFLGLGILRDYPVFPFDETKASIVDILFSIDSKIELNNKINTELESMARTLYDYWFLQFDFPDENRKPYKTNGGKMIWNEEVKKEIPKEWKVWRLIDLIDESKNGDWGAEKAMDNFIKTFCIRGTDINGLNGASDFDPPARFIEKTHSDRLLKPDDLIIEISGGSPTQSTGRMAHISQNVLIRLENRAVCSNFCKAVSLKRNILSYVVVQYWSHLYDSGVFFNFEGKTSGIRNLLFDQLAKDVKIVLPNNDELIKKYYNFADEIDSKKQNNLFQNYKLRKLRDWLLPMLMNGQVKVKS